MKVILSKLGTAFNTPDFFALSDDGLFICTLKRHARLISMGLSRVAGEVAKVALANYRPRLIFSRSRYMRQIEDAHRFQALVKDYLATEIDYVGYVRGDTEILDACEKWRPLIISNPKAPAARDL